MSLSDLFTQVAHNPVLELTCLLVLAVVLVDGWTDVLDAIATVVSTGALSFRQVVTLAAACNLLGVLIMTVISATAAETVYSIADFGPDRAAALSALCAALYAVALQVVLAWRFGVPTNESHTLVAGPTGATLALPDGLGNIRAGAQGRAFLGLVLSVALDWQVGGLRHRLLERLHPSLSLCHRGQLTGAGAMAFLHGAQDGQRSLDVFLLGITLVQGDGVDQTFSMPGWPMLLYAAVMALGTAMDERRITGAVGRDMVILTPWESLTADLRGGLCLFLHMLASLPVSATRARTAAILGTSSAGEGTVNRRVTARIAFIWLFTFLGCGLLGFLLASLFHSPLSCDILMPGTTF